MTLPVVLNVTLFLGLLSYKFSCFTVQFKGKMLVPRSNITYWKWSSGWLESWEGLLLATDVSTICAEAIFRVKKMASTLVVETSVANKSPCHDQDSSHPDNHFQSRYRTVSSETKPFTLHGQATSMRQNIGYPEYLMNQSKLTARFSEVSMI